MTLTTEDKARIFGIYLGQACFQKLSNGMFSLPLEVNGDIVNNYMLPKNTDEIKDYYLGIYPLSSITDEHAIEVANIIRPNESFQVYKRDITRLTVISEYSYIIYQDKGVLVRHYDAPPGTGEHTAIQSYDHLRYLGYALPYKGHSLFDLGIAIDKSKIKS